ncbi:hypothetical protein FOA43_004362 [Brettanomyces nanus]|uniref:Cell wall mannoprotein PIR1-like C-terminal domain-containing protein n=1 Tax=Eeniella nana TaxID=13502 RepID=A0A875S7P0_EENNA|nr:uncharacterized protein FOA43_004362 [Brettanomyces nanus]QPG76968.1 hypothetical protein FOA43_004362 [Brettanomyces nanus]
MKASYSVLCAALLAVKASAAYVPSEPWTTLTPTSIIGKTTDYAGPFGIYVASISNQTTSTTKSGNSSVSYSTSAAPVSQITDGQIQATTATAQVVSQIGDGQIQATTATKQVVSQIGDGQIQATTATKQVVSQIGDGQIQATTATKQVISQIADGQIQATTSTKTKSVVSQITDGQIQATATAKKEKEKRDATAVTQVGCKSGEALTMSLKDSILTDSAGRIGSIVANQQFQFDGPPPQAGAIYAAGWSITDDGKLAIGTTTTFYQCLSGGFYNLYDKSIGAQCAPVNLYIVDLVDC